MPDDPPADLVERVTVAFDKAESEWMQSAFDAGAGARPVHSELRGRIILAVVEAVA